MAEQVFTIGGVEYRRMAEQNPFSVAWSRMDLRTGNWVACELHEAERAEEWYCMRTGR